MFVVVLKQIELKCRNDRKYAKKIFPNGMGAYHALVQEVLQNRTNSGYFLKRLSSPLALFLNINLSLKGGSRHCRAQR